MHTAAPLAANPDAGPPASATTAAPSPGEPAVGPTPCRLLRPPTHYSGLSSRRQGGWVAAPELVHLSQVGNMMPINGKMENL